MPHMNRSGTCDEPSLFALIRAFESAYAEHKWPSWKLQRLNALVQESLPELCRLARLGASRGEECRELVRTSEFVVMSCTAMIGGVAHVSAEAVEDLQRATEAFPGVDVVLGAR